MLRGLHATDGTTFAQFTTPTYTTLLYPTSRENDMTVSYREMTGPNGLIANRAEFTGNSMRAEWTTMLPRAAWLNDVEYTALRLDWNTAVDRGEKMYVVYSYDTPIAWSIGHEPAYVVDQRFSVTTSKGQGYVRAWINHRCPKLGQEVSA
jgi:hypothetical protein